MRLDRESPRNCLLLAHFMREHRRTKRCTYGMPIFLLICHQLFLTTAGQGDNAFGSVHPSVCLFVITSPI